jgi:hypothetical protein
VYRRALVLCSHKCFLANTITQVKLKLILTGYGLDDRGSISGKGSCFLFLAKICMHPLSSYMTVHCVSINILWHVCWKPDLWSQQRQPLLDNGSVNTAISRQQPVRLVTASCRGKRGWHNNRSTVGSGVFCWVRPKALRGPAAISSYLWASREWTAEVGSWQLKSRDNSGETEERPLSEAVAKHRNWEP